MPPFEESDEATAAQLGRALDEGKAVRREIEWVKHREAVASGEMAAGPYLVTYLITPADDYYDLEAAQPGQPAHHTTVSPGSAHVAVVVRDAADGRMVNGLSVRATLRSDAGGEQVSAALPFGWHSILNRYGENLVLPRTPFTLSVLIAMPTYRRHDHVNGDRYGGDVIARFTRVAVSSDSLAAAAQRLAHGDLREAIDLAKVEGDAVDRPLADVLRVAGAGGSRLRSGDYSVTVLVREARGHWEADGRTLRYVGSDSGVGPIAHLDVIVREAATGRIVPELKVRTTVLNSGRKAIGTYSLPFMWHPWVSHYGLNVPVPGIGRYTIRVRSDAPSFRRYGGAALKRFNRAIDLEFRGVRFVTAGKR
jgi:hypothetical protein